jgi:hypothetical protein
MAYPMRRAISGVFLLLILAAITRAQPVALSVNTNSREEVRQFFRAVYTASENVPMGWTGNYATGNAGDTSPAFKESVRLRINFYRALAGVPADIAFNPTYSSKSQQSALLMSVNNDLSHTPPPTWTLYSAVGAEGALNSNLALGQAGADAINGYIRDHGANNAPVGHRRWLLYPQTLTMGTGDVPGITGNPSVPPANAVWVFDTTPGGQFGAPRPATRTTAVPYPPAGFIPHQLVWPRWSFSHPGADFAAATVTMTRNGQPVATSREPLNANVGEPTLVWVYDNRDPDTTTSHEKPAADTTYSVSVNNVRVSGAAQNFSYQVTVFDPEVAGAEAAPVAVTGPSFPGTGGANNYTVSKPAFAGGFEWRSVQLTPVTRTFTAESGLEGLVATTTSGYDVVQTASVASGARSYRLTHPAPRSDQILAVPGTFLVSGNDSRITFRSRLGIATATETARVQVSTDEGASWIDLFTQVGTSATGTGFPAATETTFVSRTLALSDYAGRSLSVRLVYSIGFGTAFIPDPTNGVGWYIDDFTLANVEAITAGATTRVATGSSFAFTPAMAGAMGLQARGVMFGAYPMEWGSVTRVNAVLGGGSSSSSFLSNLSVRTTAGTGAETLIVGFSVSGGTKALLVRGIGPTLAAFGVTGALNDPKLELFRDAAKVDENDNWLGSDAATFDRVGAFALANGSRDSAMVVSLPRGTYTAQVSGATGGTGVTLVELYDTDGNATLSRLSNVSARSQISGGGDTLIAGFNVAGSGSRTLLIRAVGPTLGQFGVTGALTDPKLELYDSAGRIQENDNWDISSRPTFLQIGAFDLATGSRDAVLVVSLPPGSYTAQVSGVGGATGVALVEVYELP